jgi:hypothetical protein
MLNISDLIEVKLFEPDDFLKVKETLTRIGVASKKEKTLYQSCHILHKQGRYFIVHFKQLFMLDGKKSDFSDDDRARLNTIANLLHDWELINLINENKSKSPVAALSQIKIITHKEKEAWKLVTKYSIGKKQK